MQNPFKAGEAVMTKVKGKQVLASVTKTWQNEVQVKTADGDLYWRTVYTVWRSGEEPLKRTVPSKNTSEPPPTKAGATTSAPKKARAQKAATSKSRRKKRS